MNLKIGTAPISWGVLLPSDPKQTPWNRFLDEVAAAGYDGTELGPYGYLPTDSTRLKKELDQRGLKVSAGYIFRHFEDVSLWPEIEKQALDTGRLLAELDAKFLVLIDDTYTSLFTGEQYKPSRLDEEAWKRLIDATNTVADLVKGFGLQVVFHNHAETHVQSEDQIVPLLEQTDPDRISLCLDTGHFAYRGGGDPVSFMRRHHKRIAYLHLKSIDRDVWEKAEREKIPFAKAVDIGIFAEPSQGVVDFLALRDVLREINYQGWATVEQDVYPAPLDKPFPIARRTRAYLREIGFGKPGI
jgi:inosose dehydratase